MLVFEVLSCLYSRSIVHDQSRTGLLSELLLLQAFEAVKERTSIVPFQAIWEGRQELPKDYYKEWLRLPYFTITAVTLGAYWAHPLMQSASHWLNW